MDAFPSEDLNSFLSGIRPGPPIELDAVIVPHLAGPLVAEAAEADLLEEAIARGATEVAELDEAGRVARVQGAHGGDRLLLLLDGEELVGAKQNRIVNLTILVAAGQSLHIPVSCVEAGRWARRSRACG